jgi:hypothetical protein
VTSLHYEVRTSAIVTSNNSRRFFRISMDYLNESYGCTQHSSQTREISSPDNEIDDWLASKINIFHAPPGFVAILMWRSTIPQVMTVVRIPSFRDSRVHAYQSRRQGDLDQVREGIVFHFKTLVKWCCISLPCAGTDVKHERSLRYCSQSESQYNYSRQ